MPEILTRVVLLGAAACLLLWAFAFHSDVSRESRWQARLAERGPAAVAEADPEGLPGRLYVRLRMAEFAVREVFPPNRTAALAVLEPGLRFLPFDARLWTMTARLRLASGEDEGARAALAFASGLNPRFPAGRLNMIPLWRLLGEEERALRLAQDVAALDDRGRTEAALALASSGFDDPEIYRLLGGEDWPAATVSRFLRTMPVADGGKRLLLARAIEPRLGDEPTLRPVLVDYLLEGDQVAEALRLWAGSRDPVAFHAGPGWPRENPLGRETGSLGFQNPVQRPGVHVIWRDGAAEMRFRPMLMSSPTWHRWRLYRLPALPEAGGVRVEMEVSTDRPRSSRVALVVRGRDREFPSEEYDREKGGRQLLAVDVPQVESPQVLDVILLREPVRDEAAGAIAVTVHDLRMEAPGT